jgi:hypothetical protein
MTDEEAKRRFLIFTAIRVTGLAMFLLGVFMAFTDVFVEGGMPIVGSILAICGAVDALLAPKILKIALEKM